MAASQATQDFLAQLRRSQLLSADDLQDAAITVGQLKDPTPQRIAQILVEDGYLTRFQAERLLEGNARGLVIDGYKLLDVLGAGGMGWVYIAEEMQTRWRVALKVLPETGRRDAGTLARFQLEAQAGMRLNHPRIVRTFALRRTEDIYGPIHYVVMELVRGVNLFELLLLKKTLEWQHACDIILQTAEGLEYAHSQGLIHRDIKPENLLVCSNGAVKILDFGLAMLDEHDEEFSMAMIFGQNRLGTADYISPEQYIDSYQVDARADIYSLGCTFYFALTGKVPFPYPTPAQKLKAHLKKRPTPVREIRPEIPERVAALVAKMMAKHPQNRVQSASDVIRYLKPLAERREVSFSFRSVLAARLAYAKKRLAGIKDPNAAKPTTDLTPILPKEPVPGSGALAPRQSTIETIVREDTQVAPPAPEGEQGKRG